jgi:hypothetical protein
VNYALESLEGDREEESGKVTAEQTLILHPDGLSQWTYQVYDVAPMEVGQTTSNIKGYLGSPGYACSDRIQAKST